MISKIINHRNLIESAYSTIIAPFSSSLLENNKYIFMFDFLLEVTSFVSAISSKISKKKKILLIGIPASYLIYWCTYFNMIIYFDTSETKRHFDIIYNLRWLRLLRIYNFIKLIDILKPISKNILKIAKFLIFIHVTTCIWIGIARLNLYQKNWISTYNIERQGLLDIYVASLYFNLNTVLTIGYGDIRSTNILEMGYNILLLLVWVCMIPFVMSSYINFGRKSEETEKGINFLNQISSEYDVPNEVYSNIHKFFSKKSNKPLSIPEILDTIKYLPNESANTLLNRLYLEYGVDLGQNQFFKEKPFEFLLEFAPLLEFSQEYKNNELIQTSDNYFVMEYLIILRGNAQIESDEGVCLAKLKSGFICDEIPPDINYKIISKNCSLISLKNTEIINLSKTTQIQILDQLSIGTYYMNLDKKLQFIKIVRHMKNVNSKKEIQKILIQICSENLVKTESLTKALQTLTENYEIYEFQSLFPNQVQEEAKEFNSNDDDQELIDRIDLLKEKLKVLVKKK